MGPGSTFTYRQYVVAVTAEQSASGKWQAALSITSGAQGGKTQRLPRLTSLLMPTEKGALTVGVRYAKRLIDGDEPGLNV
jgi:Trp operon repressor